MEKKNVLFAVLMYSFLLLNVCFAQEPSIEWQKSLGGTNYDQANAIKQTADSGYIVVGYSQSLDGDVTGNHNSADCWIVKLNNTGNIQWEKSLGGTNYDDAISVQQTSDNGYIIAGLTQSVDGDVTGAPVNNFIDFWVIKIDSVGTIDWQKSLGGTNYEEAHSIQQTTDGGYIVTGISNSTDGDVTGNHGDFDCWTVKLDAAGTIEWQQSFGGSGYDEAFSIQQTNDNGYIIAGNSSSNDGDVAGHHGTISTDYWIVKLGNTGTIEWQKSLGGTEDDQAHSIQQTSDNGYIIAGWSKSNDGDVTDHHGSTTLYDYWIVKLDSDGNIQWQKSLGGSGSDYSYSIKSTTDEGFIVAGCSDSNDGDVLGNHGGLDYWIIKMTSSGNIQWQKSLGGSGQDQAYFIDQTNDDGYIIAGWSESGDGDVINNHGTFDYWVIKLDTDVITTAQENLTVTLSVYPNPFVDQLNIEVDDRITNITLADMLGRKVPQITNIGHTIFTTNIPPGAYVVKVWTANNFFQKIVIKE